MEIVPDFEVHETHAPLWTNQDWYIALLMGGRGNGRSGTASRYSVSSLFSEEYTRGALMRAVHSDIRTSSWADVQDRLAEQSIEKAEGLHIADGDMFMEFGENSLRAHGFKASSGSLTARLKSLANYNYVWGEEAEELAVQEFMKLEDSLRTVKGRIRIILTLNTPPKSHWIIKRFFDLEPAQEAPGFYIPRLKPELARDVLYIPGTWKENAPNIAPRVAERYEGYRETNPAYYWQTIRGYSPETVMGRIYKGWKEIPSVPHNARLIGYGLDFGFDPDPAAIVAVYYHDGGYILDEKLYATRFANEDLAATFKLLDPAPIVGDSAEPKSIEEMKRLQVHVMPCEKGADSVNFGIKHVQSLRISYTATSTNLKTEYESYAWKRTKDSVEEEDHLGIEDPNCANHAMSAARYFLTQMVKANADPEAIERERVRVSFKTRSNAQRAGKRYGLG